MILPGQKVVCIDGKFDPAIAKFFWKLPVEGVVYTVRDVIRGIAPNGMGDEVCVYLVELLNPCSDADPYPERGFKAERFRPLETDTETNFETDETPEGVPEEAEEVMHH